MGSPDLVFNAQIPQCLCALPLGVQQGDLAQSVDRLDRLQVRESTRQAPGDCTSAILPTLMHLLSGSRKTRDRIQKGSIPADTHDSLQILAVE
jgi:hypothetical protein